MLKRIFPTRSMAVALLILAIVLVRQVSAAPSFTVDSYLDEIDDDINDGMCHSAANHCTLRAAIMQANKISGPPSVTINLPPGTYTLSRPRTGPNGDDNGDLNLTTPAIGVSSPVITIIGAGASTTIIDANQLDRVLHVHPNRKVSISGVTIRNGYFSTGSALDSLGGGIYNEGSLTVSDSTLCQNFTISGGGIYNKGSLSLINIILSQNIAANHGGGIFNRDGGLTVVNSTISQNSANKNANGTHGGGISNFSPLKVSNSTIIGNGAYDGGGIANFSSLTVINSTISSNNVNNNGGGIYNVSTANVYNTSIVFNRADADANGGSGGGVYNNPGATFNLRNTLVAGNTLQNASIADDCEGAPLNSFGRNLIGEDIFCTLNVVDGSWTYLSSINTLGPLQNNGGPTWTHALLPGSNAIDGADPVFGCTDINGSTIATDQRGAARPVGPACDIGAFEYGAKMPWLYLPLILS